MIVARQMLFLWAGGKSKAYLFNFVVSIDHSLNYCYNSADITSYNLTNS